MRRTLLAALALGSLACNDKEDGDTGGGTPDLSTISAQPAAGTIAGQPFALGSRSMNVSDGSLWVDLLPDDVPDCEADETSASYPFVIFFAPAAPGTYELGSSQTVTFVDAPSNNLIVTQGVIVIETLTETEVTGGLHVYDPEFGEIDGRFDGPLCYSN